MSNTSTKKTIVVTNDDGYYAPGLAALVYILQGLGDLILVAPAENRSAVGHTSTFERELRCHLMMDRYGVKAAYICDGYPADCTKLALTHLLDGRKADLVVSGINAGSNTGTAAFYSGTVAGAREALRHGVPGIAFSMEGGGDEERPFMRNVLYVQQIVRQVLAKGLPPYVGLNVNLPLYEAPPVQDLTVCTQTYRELPDRVERRVDSHGKVHYWVTGQEGGDSAPTEDTAVMASQGLAVVPFSLDTTAHHVFEEVKGIMAGAL